LGSGIRCDSGNFLRRTLLHGVTAVRDKTHLILASWPERMTFYSGYISIAFYLNIFSEITNYSINCGHLVPSTPVRKSWCTAASLWNLSSQAIEINVLILLPWLKFHVRYLLYFPADEVNEYSITLFRPSASRWRMT
jgi:hypothetical protein